MTINEEILETILGKERELITELDKFLNANPDDAILESLRESQEKQ